MSQKHLIRKYANRKLYDTRSSRYITLSGIQKLVHQGDDIQVIERDTSRDITPLILTQLVMTEERRSDSGISPGSQRGQALVDYVRRTLNVPAALVSGEVERRREDFEAVVDMAISRALRRLSVPTQRDLERVNRRLDELTARLGDAGEAGGGAGPPSRRRAAGPRRPLATTGAPGRSRARRPAPPS